MVPVFILGDNATPWLRCTNSPGKDDERFSPFCWRARFALTHKRLAGDFVAYRYASPTKRRSLLVVRNALPVLVDGKTVVSDLVEKIACYLEEAYPDRPLLFGDDKAYSLTRFIDLWGTQSLFPPLVRLVLADVLDHLDLEDAAYIRQSREKQLGVEWDMLDRQRDTYRPVFRQQLALLRLQLRQHPFLAGAAPAYARL